MTDGENGALLERMRRSRGRGAELKLQLMNPRTQHPGRVVFVFEGDDDRGVYYSWTRYVDATFRFEPFTCKGKGAVLRLKASVDRDVADLAVGVFFFIDRDFDDSRGVALDRSIYMTETYSIENSLVCREVVDEVLKIELNCHAVPHLRERVCDQFESLYDQFVAATSDVNSLLFAVRKLGIELEDDVPSSIGRIVSITHDSVARLPLSAAEFLRPVRNALEHERAALEQEFSGLDGRIRYRGKFAIAFLLRWLEALGRERREQNTELFRGLDAESRTRADRLNSVALAPRANPPRSFIEFLRDNVLAQAA